jgi:hypothetical protein
MKYSEEKKRVIICYFKQMRNCIKITVKARTPKMNVDIFTTNANLLNVIKRSFKILCLKAILSWVNLNLLVVTLIASGLTLI